MSKGWITEIFWLICLIWNNRFASCEIETSKPHYTANNEIDTNRIQRPNYLNSAENTLNNSKNALSEFPYIHPKPIDCADYLKMGYKTSGVYRIWPRSRILKSKSFIVFCDMETDNGGWTILQRRGDFLRPNDYFFKNWTSYKNGFGDIERDFWLGNDNIFALTNQRSYSVRFDLTDVEGEYRYALYDVFYIENEELKYRLTIEDYSGTANDSMTKEHNTQKFSTKDQDNDVHENNCANNYKGGWWYSSCYYANLNGLYLKGKHKSYTDGVIWYHWKAHQESLYKTEIKIRPKNFRWILV